jgi:hypothetical protein
MRVLVWLALLVCGQLSVAQVRIDNLYFNSTTDILRLNSSAVPPAITYTGIGSGAQIGEGIAHAEDEAGNVIIWVNASGVYDANGTMMPGSAGIRANPSSTEIVLCPFPGDAAKFYVFYNNELCSQLYYAVVDMRQRGGLGDVVSRNNPIDADNTYAEGLEMVKVPCSNRYWLLAYRCYSGFVRFSIDADGISAGTFLQAFNADTHLGRGELDYHNGKLGYAVTYRNRAFVSDFDALSGTITNPQELTFNATNGMYGLEFSPDASKAYFTDWHNRDFLGKIASPNLFQYDFTTGATTAWTILYSTARCPGTVVEGLGQIELGKDGKLYIPHVSGCQITVVDNPDSRSPGFSVIDVNTILSTGISDHIQSEFLNPLRAMADTKEICAGERVVLRASGGSGNYQWSPVSGIADPNVAMIEVRPVETTTYTLYAETQSGCRDSVSLTIIVKQPAITQLTALGDNPICGNISLTLKISGAAGEYHWYRDNQPVSRGTADSLLIREPGTYRVQAMSQGCPVWSESLVVEGSAFRPPQEVFVPNLITPDKDPQQTNETFAVKNYTGQLRLSIYNRWGREVFRSTDYRNDWTAEGLPSGVYFYHLTHVDACFPPVRGWVQVLR